MGPGAVTAADLVEALTRQVPDFPSPGVHFKDLTPLFADSRGLTAVTDELAEAASGADLIAGLDARGFLLGGAVAARLGTGVLAIRKGGKLPPPVRTEHYQLEYGTASLEVSCRGDRIVRAQRCDSRRRAGHRRHARRGPSAARAGRRAGDVGGRGDRTRRTWRGRDRIAPLKVHSVRRVLARR